MQTRPMLTLADVQAIAAAAEAEAKKNDWKVSIAICDDGGHLMHFQRLDGAPLTSIAISEGKARAAAHGRRPTKAFEDVIANGRNAFMTAAMAMDQGVALLEGGEPIMANGVCVGSVGVSGVTSAQDAQVARAGIAALG